jgi:pyruvate/2-oxoglutarate dehydrogenase complex dihydrolipoamide acyltransferase (E2) component
MHQRKNPFAFAKPITIDSLEELFSHHRSLTGGWSMEGDGAGDGGGGSGGEGGDGSGGDGGAGGDGGGSKFEAINSQEELDRRIGPRLQREREKYADYDDLKRKAAEFDAAQEASKTEHEKALDAARKEGESTAAQAANARIVATEARLLLTQAGAHNATAAARILGDLSGITVNDAGEVDQDALKAKVDALKTSDAYLFGTGKPGAPKPDPSQGGGGGNDQAGVDRGREMFAARRGKK